MKRAIYAAALALTVVALLTGMSLLSHPTVAHAAAATHKLAAAPRTPHAVFSNQTTQNTPGVTSANGTLYIGYAGTDNPSSIYITTIGGVHISVGQQVLSGTGVGMCTFTDPVVGHPEPYIVWAGTNNKVNIAYFDGSTTLKNVTQIPNGSGGYQTTSDTPTCTSPAAGDPVSVGWTGQGNDHLNWLGSDNGTSGWSPVITDTGDTASSGFGLVVTSAVVVYSAFAGTDNPHHLNYGPWGHFTHDSSNYTNSDVEMAACGDPTGSTLFYFTFRGATNTTIYYEIWGNNGNATRSMLSGQAANTGIGVTDWNNNLYFAWGDTSYHVNYAEVVPNCAP